MRDPLFAMGVGLIELSLAKVIPLWPSSVYLVLVIAVYVALLVFFVRRCQRSPALAMLLPLIPLAFAWRSLHTYFMFLPLLAVAALVARDRQAEEDAPVSEPSIAADRRPGYGAGVTRRIVAS
jgi:hypothetical protein